jgi:hypothetical protein
LRCGSCRRWHKLQGLFIPHVVAVFVPACLRNAILLA